MKIPLQPAKFTAAQLRVAEQSAGNPSEALCEGGRALRDYTWDPRWYNRGEEIVQTAMEEHTQVAIGSILGDGNLKQLAKRTKASQLYISQHSSKLPYLKWLHERLGKGFAMNPIKPKKGYEQYYFMTKPEKGLGYLMEKFYPEGKKIIPNDISGLLKHPLSLAVWYMDDGTLDRRSKYHYNALIATYGFSFGGCERLSETLHKNFGLEVSITRCKMRDKIYPRLYVKSRSMEKFVSLIKPFVHPIFQYKLEPK